MKRALSVILTLAIVLTLSLTVFAADGGSITVTNAKVGETYSIYKLLDLSLDDNKTAFTYTLPAGSPWEDYFTDEDTGAKWFSYDSESGVVVARATLTETTKYDAVAEALAFADNNSSVTPLKEITATDTTVVFDGLELGYYLVDTTVGASVIVETNNTDVSIADKSAGPRIVKKVQEDSDSEWGDVNTAAIGQTVNYMVTIANVRKLHHVDMRDILPEGLTFDPDSVKVYRNSVTEANLIEGETDPGLIGSDGTWYLVDATHHSPDYGAEHLGADTFHIHFRDMFINTFPANDSIIVTYSATLNENAEIGGSVSDFTGGNPNEVYLAYGAEQETVHDIVRTYTWQLPIFKYTKTASNPSQPLANAKFIFSRVPASAVAVEDLSSVSYAIVENGIITDWTTDMAQATELVSGADGMIYLTGLDSDYYQVIETAAPAGYNKLTAPIEVLISEEGVIRDTNSTVITQLAVENKTGTEMPSTGGIGTTVFYILGSVLVLGAAILLITKRRLTTEQ